MDAAIVTVGDELLVGETTNENAAWLAGEVTARGGRVREILTVGDDRDAIADAVRERAARYDRVIVTGGLGGTPDDVTMAGVAQGLDRELVVDQDVRAAAQAASEAFVEAHPDLAEKYDLGLDTDRVAQTVAGGEPLENPEGLAPGCQIENVVVLPGVPSELKATFEAVAETFAGDVVIKTRDTDAPEGVLGRHLAELTDRFDVRAGSYPGERRSQNRVRIAGEPAAVDAALAWLGDRVTLDGNGQPED
jgi:molybdenum cofactor synthesis domain-containing protein